PPQRHKIIPARLRSGCWRQSSIVCDCVSPGDGGGMNPASANPAKTRRRPTGPAQASNIVLRSRNLIHANVHVVLHYVHYLSERSMAALLVLYASPDG